MMRPRGFTLIEVLITVAIAAILASIAFPSFMGSIRKSRRAEAFEFITRIQQAQERWRANHSSYTTDLTSTGLDVPTTTPNGYYTLGVTVPIGADSGSQYTITATAAGSQVADTQCAVISLGMTGGNPQYDSTSGQTCWSK
jgi:type IV pilus assembly protein PilE